VSNVVPVLLLLLAGFLAGGAWTAWQNYSRRLSVLLAVAAALAAAAGVLRLI